MQRPKARLYVRWGGPRIARKADYDAAPRACRRPARSGHLAVASRFDVRIGFTAARLEGGVRTSPSRAHVDPTMARACQVRCRCRGRARALAPGDGATPQGAAAGPRRLDSAGGNVPQQPHTGDRPCPSVEAIAITPRRRPRFAGSPEGCVPASADRSASVIRLPCAVLANPHCGLIQRRSIGT